MLTVEKFLAESTKQRLQAGVTHFATLGEPYPDVRRHPDTVFSRVMSKEEVNEALKSSPDLLINCVGVTVVSDDHAFFFTDDATISLALQHYPPRPRFMAGSFRVPMRVKPRPGLEGGVIQTAEDIITVFESGKRYLATNEEVVAYYNEVHVNGDPPTQEERTQHYDKGVKARLEGHTFNQQQSSYWQEGWRACDATNPPEHVEERDIDPDHPDD